MSLGMFHNTEDAPRQRGAWTQVPKALRLVHCNRQSQSRQRLLVTDVYECPADEELTINKLFAAWEAKMCAETAAELRRYVRGEA